MAHSLSPVLHSAAGQSADLDVHYRLFDVAPEALPTWLAQLDRRQLVGFNATIPHKEAMARHVDRLTPLAARLGAVNTITVDADGTLEGHNTDVEGFQRDLVAHLGGIPRHRAVVLGAGGSARAVAVALEALGFNQLIFLNRSLARAEHLVSDLALSMGECGTLNDLSEALVGASVLVSTLPHGVWATASGASLDQALAHTRPGAVICDIAYGGGESLLLSGARRHGRVAMDGLGMLVHQGVLAFMRWTGQQPDLPAVMSAVRAAARARS